MKNLKEIAFLIQARTESVRVPEKLIRPFAGTTLFEIAVEKVCSSKLINKYDFYSFIRDPRLIEIIVKYGSKMILRSEKSCEEPISLKQLTGEWVDLLKDKYKYFILLNPCNAIVSIETIDKFINDFICSDVRGMTAVVSGRNFIFGEDGRILPKYDAPEEYKTSLESKFLEKHYQLANTLYAGTIEDLDNGIYMGDFKTPDFPKLFEKSQKKFFDIDEKFQFDLAEYVYNSKISGAEKKLLDKLKEEMEHISPIE